MELELNGHVALVTGSSGGVGAAIASELVSEGCRVLVHGRDERAADGVVEAITAAGGEAETVLADLTDPAQVETLGSAADAAGVDIVVANAGPFAEDGWDDVRPEVWDATYHANVTATAALIGGLLLGLRTRGWGRVITVGTRATLTPLPHMASYSAAKAAVENMTIGLAQHLSGTGVTANCVSPGVILTPSLSQMFLDREPDLTRSWADIEPEVTARYAPNPAGRLGRPDDIAAMVAFVASPRAGYVNGAVLRVDGGITGAS